MAAMKSLVAIEVFLWKQAVAMESQCFYGKSVAVMEIQWLLCTVNG
jgi:hypothetical protein